MMQDADNFDRKIVRNLRQYGKKIKKYELALLLKRDFACSELEVSQSLERLVGNNTVTKTDSGEYMMTIL